MLISSTVKIPTYRSVDSLGPVNGVAARKLVLAATSPVVPP